MGFRSSLYTGRQPRSIAQADPSCSALISLSLFNDLRLVLTWLTSQILPPIAPSRCCQMD